MMAIGVMVDLLKHKQPYKQQLAPMLTTFILPCFKSPYGHIRAKAAWLCGVFSDTDFSQGAAGGGGGGKGQGQVYEQLFASVVQCMSDPELPVRVDSVVSRLCRLKGRQSDLIAPDCASSLLLLLRTGGCAQFHRGGGGLGANRPDPPQPPHQHLPSNERGGQRGPRLCP